LRRSISIPECRNRSSMAESTGSGMVRCFRMHLGFFWTTRSSPRSGRARSGFIWSARPMSAAATSQSWALYLNLHMPVGNLFSPTARPARYRQGGAKTEIEEGFLRSGTAKNAVPPVEMTVLGMEGALSFERGAIFRGAPGTQHRLIASGLKKPQPEQVDHKFPL